MYGGRRQVRLENGRATAIGGVIAVHLLLGIALVTGLAGRAVEQVSDSLKTFEVLPDPPPPPQEPPPAEARAPDEAPAPPAPKAVATPVVAPPPEVRLPDPPPIAAAPVAGQGNASASGAALSGIGTGAGGSGTGTGGGGDGGGSNRAQRIAGALHDSDYPRAAKRAGAQGTVAIAFIVRADGRVEQCELLSSSGHPALDATTCRLVEKRFRYRPASDPSGRPVASRVQTVYTWSIHPRSRDRRR